jgi:ferredoxin-NADP reductase/nitrite reductase/ring-hydroxylating ferredoxin subunit
MVDDPFHVWHPVATSHDLPHRTVFHGQLLGRELAIWRADDDFVNVWENRCLHRGVRLSIGTNDGSELTCQYHGWRYANRSAGCTYIPAHPADAPARTICNRTFPTVERYGLIWSGEDPAGELPAVAALEGRRAFGLRNLPVNAPVALVVQHLRDYQFHDEVRLDDSNDYSVTLTTSQGETVVFFVQPVDSARSVIRGVLADTPPEADRLRTLRHHAAELTKLVDVIEVDAARQPSPQPFVAKIDEVPVGLSGLPAVQSGRTAPLRVVVQRKWDTADGVAALELAPIGDVLPTFQAGAHIDVHLPNGLVRQYSITNGPGETSTYRIGVKLEPDSRGGSQCIHETVREGDVLAISEPRNNFPLRRDAVRTILIAGGIGITPMLAMAQTLALMGLRFELHTFVRSSEHQAFPEILTELGSSVVHHQGLKPDETGAVLQTTLSNYDDASHVYICGPGPMLEATRSIAADSGWPDEAVHFEYFKNTTEIDDSSTFEISLARSALTLQVPSGKTILEVLRENDVPMPSSCEQGACGTCVVSVIEGEPDHQDVRLTEAERAAGDQIMTCVSRAKTDRLVLDL